MTGSSDCATVIGILQLRRKAKHSKSVEWTPGRGLAARAQAQAQAQAAGGGHTTADWRLLDRSDRHGARCLVRSAGAACWALLPRTQDRDWAPRGMPSPRVEGEPLGPLGRGRRPRAWEQRGSEAEAQRTVYGVRCTVYGERGVPVCWAGDLFAFSVSQCQG